MIKDQGIVTIDTSDSHIMGGNMQQLEEVRSDQLETICGGFVRGAKWDMKYAVWAFQAAKKVGIPFSGHAIEGSVAIRDALQKKALINLDKARPLLQVGKDGQPQSLRQAIDVYRGL